MILDERSFKEENVVILVKTFESVDSAGNVVENELGEAEDVTERRIWNIYRLPYDDACFFWTVLSVKPGFEDEKYFIKTIRPESA